MLFQVSVAPVFAYATESMHKIKKNAPPKWVRIGTWCLAFVLSMLYNVFFRDYNVVINYFHLIMSIIVTIIGYFFFYEGSFLHNITITIILTIAGISAELVSGICLWILDIPNVSGDFHQTDMMLISLIGAFTSNFAMFFVASLWRKFQLQKRMPRNSMTFAIMSFLLLLPTALFAIEVYQNDKTVSLLNIASMAGAFIVNILLICVQFNQANKEELEKEFLSLKHQTELERQHYQNIETRREDLAKIRHDYNNQLSSVLGLLRMNNTQEAEKVIQSLLDKVEKTREYPYCGIPIINAILSEKEKECHANGIELHPDLLLPENVAIMPIDLCSIFSNLMDNAIRACTHLPTEVSHSIVLRSSMQGDYLLIQCSNKSIKAPGTHPEGSGYGTKILQDIAKRYKGCFQTEFTDGIFTAQLILLNLT